MPSGRNRPAKPARGVLQAIWRNPKKETSMSQPARIIKTTTEDLPQEFIDLAAVVRQLPAEHLEKVGPSLDRVLDSTKRRRRILTLVQDALSQLRLDMKYLAFDLEATRRERDDYRRQLEESR
jgi:hypothetical protein